MALASGLVGSSGHDWTGRPRPSVAGVTNTRGSGPAGGLHFRPVNRSGYPPDATSGELGPQAGLSAGTLAFHCISCDSAADAHPTRLANGSDISTRSLAAGMGVPEGSEANDYAATDSEPEAVGGPELGSVLKELERNLVPGANSTMTVLVALIGLLATEVGEVFVLYASSYTFGGLPLGVLRSMAWPWTVLSLRRKQGYWGTVFDSVTKQPLDPVVVKLVNAQTGETVEQATTDILGRYGFLAREGTFTISAEKTHYRFPSERLTGQLDLSFDHLYFGEPIVVTASDVVAPNIPMDPLAPDWNQINKQRFLKFNPYQEQLLRILVRGVFWVGFIWVALAAYHSLHWPALLSLGACSVVAIMRVALPRERLWGRVYEAGTNLVLGNLILELSPPTLHAVMGKAESGPDGRFFLRAHPGSYELLVYNKTPHGTTGSLLAKRPVRVGKSGVLNANIAL